MEKKENKRSQELPTQEETSEYTPRPRWQILLAWVALAIFITGVILYYAQIMHKY